MKQVLILEYKKDRKMNSIDKDKLLHFFWNMILIIPLIYVFGDVRGCVLLSLIGALKEVVWDWLMKKGNPELLDWIYGCLPIPIYFILHSIQ